MIVSLSDIEIIVKSLESKLKRVAREAYLFGSVVEGCAIAGESDLDMLIIPDKKVDYFSLLDEEITKLLDLGIVMHLHIADNVTYRNLVSEVRRKGLRIV